MVGRVGSRSQAAREESFRGFWRVEGKLRDVWLLPNAWTHLAASGGRVEVWYARRLA